MTHRLSAAILLLTLALPSIAWALPEVFVEPLSLYNTPDLDNVSQGLRAILASRLEGDGYRVRTEGTPDQQVGNWVVRTSITRLGSTYSVDAALVPVAGDGEGARKYETTNNPDELMPTLERVAEQLRVKLTHAAGRPSPPAATPAPSGAPQTAIVPIPPSSTPDLSDYLGRQRTGPEVRGEARSLTVCDADADGNVEVLVLTAESITAFRDHGEDLVLAWDAPAPRNFTPTTLSSGDLDGNGIPELFVAGLGNGTPETRVLEWYESALGTKGTTVSAFLRAVPHPDRGTLLLGMRGGSGEDLFARGIRRYTWKNGSYQEAGKFPAPPGAVGVNLDFHRMGDGNEPLTIVTTQGDRLEAHGSDGTRVFSLDENVKGSRVRLSGDPDLAPVEDQQIIQISGATPAWTGTDGRSHLLVYQNSGGVGRIFQRLSNFSNSRIVSYTWDGVGLAATGKSAEYSGYIADVGTWPASGGQGEAVLYAALVKGKGAILKENWTRVLAYDLH